MDNEVKTVEETKELEVQIKQVLITYTGLKKKPENKEVTVQMILDVLVDEFPELLFPVAEENYIRGYEQACSDFEQYVKSQEAAEPEKKDA